MRVPHKSNDSLLRENYLNNNLLKGEEDEHIRLC